MHEVELQGKCSLYKQREFTIRRMETPLVKMSLLHYDIGSTVSVAQCTHPKVSVISHVNKLIYMHNKQNSALTKRSNSITKIHKLFIINVHICQKIYITNALDVHKCFTYPHVHWETFSIIFRLYKLLVCHSTHLGFPWIFLSVLVALIKPNWRMIERFPSTL